MIDLCLGNHVNATVLTITRALFKRNVRSAMFTATLNLITRIRLTKMVLSNEKSKYFDS